LGGVSDEDLFNKDTEELRGCMRSGPAIFSSCIILLPITRLLRISRWWISLYDSEEKHRLTTARWKYADHALGEFIETARQADYWKTYCYSDVADQ